MTLVELAAAAEVSKQATSKAVKAGRINHTVNPDGSFFFDPADKTVQAYINKRPVNRRKALKERAAAPAQSSNAPAKSKETQTERRKRTIAEAKKDDATTGQGTDEPEDPDDSDLDAQFLRVKIEEKTITNAQKRGELIPVSLVRQFIQRIYAADSDELDQLSNRLAGKLSGEARGAKSDAEASIRVAHILSQESARIKKHVHAVQKDFTKRYPEAPIEGS